MSKKIQITERQKQQFNQMLNALKKIKSYQSPDKLRKDSEKEWGLEYVEALGMAYENMQNDAFYACKGVKEIKTNHPIK